MSTPFKAVSQLPRTRGRLVVNVTRIRLKGCEDQIRTLDHELRLIEIAVVLNRFVHAFINSVDLARPVDRYRRGHFRDFVVCQSQGIRPSDGCSTTDHAHGIFQLCGIVRTVPLSPHHEQAGSSTVDQFRRKSDRVIGSKRSRKWRGIHPTCPVIPRVPYSAVADPEQMGIARTVHNHLWIHIAL